MENNSFKRGIRDGIPICLGYLSVSFAFGIFATSQGLSTLEAVMISAFNLASAGQLAAVPLIVGAGSIFELALTQLVINLRYSLMSVSLSQRMGRSIRTRDRLLIAFVITDEVFAISYNCGASVGRLYMYGLIIPPFLGWTLGTLLGAVAGNILPALLVSALGIAIYAMFVAIVVPAARAEGRIALCALIAVALSCAFEFIPFLSRIPSGFVIIISATLAAAVMTFACPIEDDEGVGAGDGGREAAK